MCTAMSLINSNGENFFGRNMDFSHDILPHLFTVPRDYQWKSGTNQAVKNKFSFIGIGQKLDNLLAFFDGVNEKGFAIAALYFAGHAVYDNCDFSDSKKIANFDIVHYLLGKCENVEEIGNYLRQICITGVADPVTETIAPLHWLASDTSGKSVTIEQTDDGLFVYKNSIGVLANSPDFKWQMTNLRNYTQASPTQTELSKWGSVKLSPFGQAGGTSVLPGGFTSPERFARTAYLKSNLPIPIGETETVCACFNIMNSTFVPKGAVLTAKNAYDYTRYTAFCNTNSREYYFITYNNLQIRTASLSQNDITADRIHDFGSIESDMEFQKLKYAK